MAQQIECVEQRARRLEGEVITAQGARDQSRRSLAKALEQYVNAEQLLGAARANFNAFQAGLIADALHDIERLRLPPASAA